MSMHVYRSPVNKKDERTKLVHTIVLASVKVRMDWCSYCICTSVQANLAGGANSADLRKTCWSRFLGHPPKFLTQVRKNGRLPRWKLYSRAYMSGPRVRTLGQCTVHVWSMGPYSRTMYRTCLVHGPNMSGPWLWRYCTTPHTCLHTTHSMDDKYVSSNYSILVNRSIFSARMIKHQCYW